MSTYGAFIPPVMSTGPADAGAAALELLGRGVGTSLSEADESTARRFEAGLLEDDDEDRFEDGGVGAEGFFFFLGERGNDISRGGGTGFDEAARRIGLPNSSMGNRLQW
jgi:hypothetical protein